MRKRLLLVTIFILLVGACSSKTQVHLFATHLSKQKVEQIVKKLDKNLFELHVNQQSFPQEIENNALIYVPSIKYSERIRGILTSLESLGYDISSTSLLSQGKHSYTANNIGLYLFPDNYVAKTPKYKIELINEYGAIDCKHDTSLTLKADHTFLVQVDVWHQAQEEYLPQSYQGKWVKVNEQIELTNPQWSQALSFTRSTSEYNHKYGRSHVVSLVPLSNGNNNQLKQLNCTYTISLAL